MSERPCTGTRLSVGQCASLACVLEATAPKPGNVHRGADFDDMTYVDLTISAVAIAAAMETAWRDGVGPAALDAVRATRALVGINTNLGTVLLLAPLATVPRTTPLGPGVRQVLAQLTARDSAAVYAAIRLARPGGLGQVHALDVADPAPDDLLAAMRAASPRDLVAHQYVSGFTTVLDQVLPWLLAGPGQGWTLADTIVHTQLRLLSQFGDSLIARKGGPAVSRQAARRARRVLEAGEPGTPPYARELAELDRWLRSDGHRRNPGTTADLIAAGLFAALRDDLLHPPY